MLLSEVAALPTTLSTSEAAALLGVSRDHLWALVRDGESPVPVLRLGRRLRWPTADLLRAVGIDVAGALAMPKDDAQGPLRLVQGPEG